MFSYERWANAEALKALKNSGNVPEKCIKLFSHIISAQWLWLERLKSEEQSYAVWPDFTWQQCEEMLPQLAKAWDDYLSALNLEDLGRIVAYRNSKGETWSNSVGDILTHVILHSAYHRGQLASQLRGGGESPPYTDFIHCARQGFI